VEPRGSERSPMASEIPIVRSFVACREIVADSVANTVSLTNLIHVVEPLPGEVAPYIVEPLALYALLTNGRGVHQFAVELVRFDMGQEQVVGRVGPVKIDLGQDPVVVHGLPIPLRNVVFSRPGQHAFHLVCDGQDIADEKILVR
jgi:uncharacterized protein DUF6941